MGAPAETPGFSPSSSSSSSFWGCTASWAFRKSIWDSWQVPLALRGFPFWICLRAVTTSYVAEASQGGEVFAFLELQLYHELGSQAAEAGFMGFKPQSF